MKELEESKFIENSNGYILLPISIEGPYKNEFTKYIFKRFPILRKKIKALMNKGLLDDIGSLYKFSFQIGKKGYGIIVIVTGKTIDAPIRPSYVERALDRFLAKYRELIVTSLSINVESFGMNNLSKKKTKEFFDNFVKNVIVNVKIH